MAQPEPTTRNAAALRPAIPVEQAVYHRPPDAPPALVARSPGFADAWLPEIEILLTDFGERPAGVPCPSAVFAQPLGAEYVAVVQVADGAGDSPGRSPALGFRVLVLPRADYRRYLGDPFAVADRFPPVWHATGALEALSMPAEPLPPRTVAQVQKVLQRVKAHALREDEEPLTAEQAAERAVALAESPALLGGVQVLVDGGRVVFERPGPDTELMRGLWTLLPTSTRTELWPASFAFGNALGFDALIVARARGQQYEGYTNEDQAAEYPQGNYELRLQVAAEAGDQHELDALFGRRSWAETWRLGLTLLAVLAVLVVVLRFIQPGGGRPEPRHLSPAERAERAALAAGAVSAADPWTALNFLHIGHKKWSSEGRTP
jgi:hypothetical protein